MIFWDSIDFHGFGAPEASLGLYWEDPKMIGAENLGDRQTIESLVRHMAHLVKVENVIFSLFGSSTPEKKFLIQNFKSLHVKVKVEKKRPEVFLGQS